MNWLSNFLTSSIGRKLIMSLTGLFLIIFLVAHLVGNLQLLANDGGVSFNVYAKFMTGNPLIKTISYGLYFFIILHAIVGIMLWRKNKKAKGSKYAISPKNQSEVSWASKNMGLLGTFILAFIFIHMGDFWWKMHNDHLKLIEIDGVQTYDLYARVKTAFSELWIVIGYLIGMIILSFHLWHGFQSAFQTLGINHPKYTPFIKGLGKVYAIVVPAAFAVIPLYYYFVLR